MQKSELIFFKSLLESRRKEILKSIHTVQKELIELGTCELNDEGDYASTGEHLQIDTQLILKQQQELKEIDHSLGKLSRGEYGSCEMCDDDIGFQRLKVKPQALYCIHCRAIAEKA
ncbi:MAG: RNA polymerase-binding protein DksA [Campylobacterales bacterium]|nr:RNA polymerase-binding protein DksA [Campylobacterales bacterium]